MTASLRKPWFAWLFVVATACRPGGPGDGEVQDVERLPLLSAVEVLRVGSVEDPVAGFSRIGDVHLTPSGLVYVLDAAALEFRVFDPDDGRFIRSVGRPGEGPGEFGSITRSGVLGDTLWVTDTRFRRISWFGPDGELLLTTPAQGAPLEVPGIAVWVIPFYPLSTGLIDSNRFAVIASGGAPVSHTYPVLRFDRDGQVVDTLRWEYARAPRSVVVSGSDFVVPNLEPLGPLSHRTGDDVVIVSWDVAQGATEGRIDVARVTPDRDTVPIAAFRYSPVPVPESVADSLLASVLPFARYYGVGEGELSRALESAMQLPEYRPPVRAVRQAADGGVWIELLPEAADSTDWLVIRSDGSPRGRLRLPANVEVRNASGDAVWAAATDDLDVPWLVRLQLE